MRARVHVACQWAVKLLRRRRAQERNLKGPGLFPASDIFTGCNISDDMEYNNVPGLQYTRSLQASTVEQNWNWTWRRVLCQIFWEFHSDCRNDSNKAGRWRRKQIRVWFWQSVCARHPSSHHLLRGCKANPQRYSKHVIQPSWQVSTEQSLPTVRLEVAKHGRWR